jgi:hypothetical protein
MNKTHVVNSGNLSRKDIDKRINIERIWIHGYGNFLENTWEHKVDIFLLLGCDTTLPRVAEKIRDIKRRRRSRTVAFVHLKETRSLVNFSD